MPEWCGTCLQEFRWEAETINPNAYLLSCCGWGFVTHVSVQSHGSSSLLMLCVHMLRGSYHWNFSSCGMWLLKTLVLWNTRSHNWKTLIVFNIPAPWQPLWTPLLPSHSCVYFYRVVNNICRLIYPYKQRDVSHNTSLPLDPLGENWK